MKGSRHKREARPQALSTLAIHAGEEPDPTTGALTPPLHMSAAFRLPGFGPDLFDALTMESTEPPFAYARWGNPTARALEAKIAALEGGEAALTLATGMAAVSALCFTFLKSGDHVVASEVCYAGSVELFGIHLPRQGIEVSLVDTSDLKQVREALRPNTRLVYLETPANPILRISDIPAVASIAHAAGALLAVDSTWATPCLQQPLAMGADYVIHSATKYLNGHGDALGGAIAVLMAQEHPDKTGKLVLIDSAGYPIKKPFVIRMAEMPLAAEITKLFFGRWMVRWNLKEVFFNDDLITEEKIDAYYFRMCTDHILDAKVSLARSLNSEPDDSYIRRIADIKNQTLIIWGENDEWIPLESGYQFKNDLSNSELVILPECGHIPQEEKPEQTAKIIINFIERDR